MRRVTIGALALAAVGVLGAGALNTQSAEARETREFHRAVTAVASMTAGCDAGCTECSCWWFYHGIEMPNCLNCGYDETIAFSGCACQSSWPESCPSQNSECGPIQPGGGDDDFASATTIKTLWEVVARGETSEIAQLLELPGLRINEERHAIQAFGCGGNVLAHVPLAMPSSQP